MVKEKLIRLSKIKEDLDFHGVKDGQSIGYAELVKYIEENYPYIKISKTPHLSSVPQRIAIEMVKDMAHPSEPTKDAREHLYLLLPRGGNYIVPYNVKNKENRKVIKICATVYGTIDLAEFTNKLDDGCTIHDMAEYLKKRHYAKEIGYEEFKSRAVKGLRPSKGRANIPVDLTKTDKWERQDSHLEILAGKEEVDKSLIEGG